MLTRRTALAFPGPAGEPASPGHWRCPLRARAQRVGVGWVQRRMTFSEGVSASMKAGRLKMRSAYFSSGAAFLLMSMP